jgi:hypothetical protein
MNTALRNDNATGQGREVGKAEATNEASLSIATADGVKVAPAYPKPNTQPARLLVALLQRRRIHPLAGWKALGIYRLSDTVLQLRKMGWPVITGRLDVNNRFGEPCHVALYSLPAESIESAGSKGAEYIANAEAERQAA